MEIQGRFFSFAAPAKKNGMNAGSALSNGVKADNGPESAAP